MAKEQSMSNMQKLANAEYFKDGGGPLFPGPLTPTTEICPIIK